jgi:hypothetical protein
MSEGNGVAADVSPHRGDANSTNQNNDQEYERRINRDFFCTVHPHGQSVAGLQPRLSRG